MGVGRPAHHHPIHPLQLLLAAGQVLQAAVELDRQLRAVVFELLHPIPAQRWDGAVLLRIEALQPGLAGMHGEALGPATGHGVHEGQQLRVGVALIDADAVLDGHRQR